MKEKIFIFSLLFNCFSCIKSMNQKASPNFFWRTMKQQENYDTDSIDDLGYTQLSWAVIHGNVTHVHNLINKGANLLFKDRTGATPLDLAHLYQHENIARLITQELSKKSQLK